MLYTTVQLLRRIYVAATKNLPTMTKTSDTSTDDTTMSDAPVRSDTDTESTCENIPTKVAVKISFKLKKTDSLDISNKHRDILLALIRADPSCLVHDSEGSCLSLNPESKIDNKFKYETLPRKHFQLVCVSHNITTKVTFSNLKSAIRNALSSSRATLTVNTWSTLDVRDAGWLLQMHPRLHNRDDITERLRRAIQQITTDQVPTFRLYTKTISNGKPSDMNRKSTQVIVVECETSSLFKLRELLHKIYSTNTKSLPGKFIPMNFQHIQSGNAYTQLIQQQQNYLESHRNISISEITLEDLQTEIEYKNNKLSIQNAINQTNYISWYSPDNSSSPIEKINFSTDVSNYPSAISFLKNVIKSNISRSSLNVTYHESNITMTPQLSSTTKNYLNALTSNLSISTKSPQTSNQSKHSHTIPASNISSVTSPTAQLPSTVMFDNLKEHISRSLKTLRQEFISLQTELRNEIKSIRISQTNKSTSPTANISHDISHELSSSISSIKHDFESFRTHVQHELKTQLQSTIALAIQSTTDNLTSMITNEVNKALRSQLQAMSPRNRKPKRSRAPNIDEPISQRLFTSDHEPDDTYELANELFEANMTIRPNSPNQYTSDAEESNTHQP